MEQFDVTALYSKYPLTGLITSSTHSGDILLHAEKIKLDSCVKTNLASSQFYKLREYLKKTKDITPKQFLSQQIASLWLLIRVDARVVW